MTRTETPLRLRHKHAPTPRSVAAVDAIVLIRDQSLARATLGALFAWVILNLIWVYSGMLLDRFFPWFSIVQGFFIGRAVQHFGRGLDWRFPAMAATVAIVAAFTGSFISALFLTGREFDTGALPLIAEISWHTVKTFATREFGVVGTIYAGAAAAIAAFYANRRLNRNEAVALRRHREQGDR